MPSNPAVEAWVSSQMALFWTYISENEIECSVEDPQQFINELLEELYRIAMDEYLACLARQAALSLYAGFPVDLGCVQP